MYKNENMRITNSIILLLIMFNLFFPKGGIKINDIPITIGMILIVITVGYQLVKNILENKLFFISKERALILLSWLPFQLILIVSILFNGFSNFGIIASMIFNFIFLPWGFLFISGRKFDELDKRYLFKLIRIGIIFIAIYGIVNFIYKYVIGDFINIPFLTVNADDFEMAEEKNLNRNGIFKLVSTYQNGNIYGVSILLLLPLFCYLEKSSFMKLIVKVSLLLTLSRTVWIGLLLYELFYILYIKFSIKKLISFFVIIMMIILSILFLLNFIGVDTSFLLDSNLGGRADSITSLNVKFISDNEILIIPEIVYIGIINNFGVLGFICFLLAIATPILLYITKISKNDVIKKTIILGNIIYLIIAGSDGAILLIPVMIFYWFILLMLTSKI